jgi:SAM-dependent methyltransferase
MLSDKGRYKSPLTKDIIGWDVVNWGRALKFWSKYLNDIDYKCLELGSHKGGLSLWLAMNGYEVICSDLEPPDVDTINLHKNYNIPGKISYAKINALNIPYRNYFDVIIFKSILGGISRNNNDELKKKTLDEIHKSLKPNGFLLFAENLEASHIHQILRKKFVKWGSNWNYLKVKEIEQIFSSYSKVEYFTTGFFGAFGRSEIQRDVLGRIDGMFEGFIPKNKRYIVIGVAFK